jgi:uncharacterized protein YbjT (DUF2867 family)
MPKKLNVLVTGATGQQGGALARVLLERGHHVRAFTRNPNSAAAQELSRRGAEVVKGDLSERASIEAAARETDTVFAVSTPFEAGMDAETQQGINVADAAKAAGVPHLIYTSVSKADEHTGIPHFDSKMRVEQHIRALGVPFTIMGPGFFMENLLSPWWLPGLQEGRFAMALPPERKLHQIALEDLGSFAALVVESRDRFLGRRIDIASDEIAGQDVARILSRFAGRRVDYVELPLSEVRAWNEDFAIMFDWFNRKGLRIDVPALHREFPQVGWHTFESWAGKQNWSLLRKAAS